MTSPLSLSPRYSRKREGRGKLQASVESHGRAITAPPPSHLTSPSPPGRRMSSVSTVPAFLRLSGSSSPPPSIPPVLRSKSPLLQESRCQAPAAFSPAQDGSLVKSHPYVTGSSEDREHSLTDNSTSTKQQHPLTVCQQSAFLFRIYPGAEENCRNLTEEKPQRFEGLRHSECNLVSINDAVKPNSEC